MLWAVTVTVFKADALPVLRKQHGREHRQKQIVNFVLAEEGKGEALILFRVRFVVTGVSVLLSRWQLTHN